MAESAEASGATSEELDKPARDREELARKWCAEIKAAEKAQKKWVERGQKIEKIYADERDMTTARQRKFNILYSNVETLRPAVYMQTPKAKAVRRYRDRDPVARLASMMLERSIQTSCELYDFDNGMDQAVRDRLLPGRGVLWAVYEPGMVGDGDDMALAYENAKAIYVPWTDFLHSVARHWDEVRWVARRFFKTRSELAKWLLETGIAQDEKAAKRQAQTIQLDYTSEGKEKSEEGQEDARGKAQIWEVHDKTSGKVIYVAPGSNEYAIVGMRPPAIQFRGFFPTPRPMLGCTTAKSLIPTPDYAQYQDQAEELNRITERIGVLQKALKMAGVYASESEELAQLIEAGDNRMIPVKNWAMFAEGGGAKSRIEWFPVEQVIVVLEGLYKIRDQAKVTLYEVSGIGDILRGVTDPDETATAQGIKSKWGSLRVRRVQKDVQRYAADILELKAEIIAEKFEFSTILAMAGVDQELLEKYAPKPPPPQLPPGAQQDPMAQQVIQQQAEAAKQQAIKAFLQQVEQLLRNDVARSFRIDVESDSTLEPDMQEEKQAAIEYLTAMGAFMKEGQTLIASGPEGAKLFGEMLLFATRRFDKVDQLEQAIEQAMEAAAQPRPPQPDPEMIKAQSEAERAKAEIAIKTQESQVRVQETTTKVELEREKIGLERELAKIDAMLKAKELQLKSREIDIKDAELGLKGQEVDLKGREIETRSTLEREKLKDGKEAREFDGFHRDMDRKASAEQKDKSKEEAAPKQDRSGEAIGKGLEALAAAMAKPKTIRRGADGRPEGIE